MRVIQALLGHVYDHRAIHPRGHQDDPRTVSPYEMLARLQDQTVKRSLEVTGHRGCPEQRWEIADIFRASGPAWRQANAGHVSLSRLKVMSAIEACRTEALGGHVAGCTKCNHHHVAYNSGKNRHCPKVSGSGRPRLDGGASQGSAACGILPRCLHHADRDRADRPLEQEGDPRAAAQSCRPKRATTIAAARTKPLSRYGRLRQVKRADLGAGIW